MKTIIYILILLLFRKLTQLNITNFTVSQFIKLKEKDDNYFNTISKCEYITSDDGSEISEQIVFS